MQFNISISDEQKEKEMPKMKKKSAGILGKAIKDRLGKIKSYEKE